MVVLGKLRLLLGDLEHLDLLLPLPMLLKLPLRLGLKLLLSLLLDLLMLVLDRQRNQGLHKQSKNLDIDHELDLAL